MLFQPLGNRPFHLSPESRDNPVVNHLIQNESMNKDLVMFDGGPTHESEYYEGYPSDAEEEEIEGTGCICLLCFLKSFNLNLFVVVVVVSVCAF